MAVKSSLEQLDAFIAHAKRWQEAQKINNPLITKPRPEDYGLVTPAEQFLANKVEQKVYGRITDPTV